MDSGGGGAGNNVTGFDVSSEDGGFWFVSTGAGAWNGRRAWSDDCGGVGKSKLGFDANLSVSENAGAVTEVANVVIPAFFDPNNLLTTALQVPHLWNRAAALHVVEVQCEIDEEAPTTSRSGGNVLSSTAFECGGNVGGVCGSGRMRGFRCEVGQQRCGFWCGASDERGGEVCDGLVRKFLPEKPTTGRGGTGSQRLIVNGALRGATSVERLNHQGTRFKEFFFVGESVDWDVRGAGFINTYREAAMKSGDWRGCAGVSRRYDGRWAADGFKRMPPCRERKNGATPRRIHRPYDATGAGTARLQRTRNGNLGLDRFCVSHITTGRGTGGGGVVTGLVIGWAGCGAPTMRMLRTAMTALVERLRRRLAR
jgi:hypothetical protein